MSRLRVAIDEQLKHCSQVITLGVRSQIGDYTVRERGLLRAADVIFYPTVRFVDLFATLGKETFPSVNCYRLLGDELKQTALLRLLNVPHPRTRVYYGDKQKQEILREFEFPFIAKRPFRSSGGRNVFLLRDRKELDWYSRQFNPAYIQEYVPGRRKLSLIVLNCTSVFGYWKTAAPGDSTCSLTQGGEVQMDEIPPDAVSLGKYIACAAGLSDVAVELVSDGNRFLVLGLNFRYGETGWLKAWKVRLVIITGMIARGEI